MAEMVVWGYPRSRAFTYPVLGDAGAEGPSSIGLLHQPRRHGKVPAVGADENTPAAVLIAVEGLVHGAIGDCILAVVDARVMHHVLGARVQIELPCSATKPPLAPHITQSIDIPSIQAPA